MSYITKDIFAEKSLLSEMIDGVNLQIVEVNKKIYIIAMSELKLDKKEKTIINFFQEDGVISINAIKDDEKINKFTQVSTSNLLGETAPATGVVINYDIPSSNIYKIKRFLSTKSDITLINFVVDEMKSSVKAMKDYLFFISDRDEFLEETTREFPEYDISKDSTTALKDVTYEIALKKELITPFFFINKKEDLGDLEKIKLPDYVSEVNVIKL